MTDTWLHFSTKTIIFTQVGANPNVSGLGFGIHPKCSNLDSVSDLYSCDDNIYSNSSDGGSGALKILANISDTTLVLGHTGSQKQYKYVASPQSSRLFSLDYTVGTYAIYTQCMPITARCLASGSKIKNLTNTCIFDDNIDWETIGYNSFAWNLTFFTNATAAETTSGPTGNPYYWSTTLYTGQGMILSGSLKADPDINTREIPDGEGAFVMVTCNSSVYDVTYSSVKNSITDWRPSLSNSTTSELHSSADGLRNTLGMPYLNQAVGVAGFSKTAREIADKFALAYSQVALAGTAVVFEPRDAMTSQKREQIQVAMVPKTPLYVLIAANLLLVLFGIILSTIALVALEGDTGEVQARLSIHALVAAAFEARAGNPVKEVEDFFEEKHGEQGPRLGFVKTMDGGWTIERHDAHREN